MKNCTPLTDYQLTTKNYYTWSQTAVFCHFHYSFRKTVSLEEIRKVRKIGQNEAFQEEKYNDKNIIHLPRQVTKIVLKTFENQEFFQNPT